MRVEDMHVGHRGLEALILMWSPPVLIQGDVIHKEPDGHPVGCVVQGGAVGDMS